MNTFLELVGESMPTGIQHNGLGTLEQHISEYESVCLFCTFVKEMSTFFSFTFNQIADRIHKDAIQIKTRILPDSYLRQYQDTLYKDLTRKIEYVCAYMFQVNSNF